MGDVLEQHGFAQAVGSDHHHVGGLFDEGKRVQFLHQRAITLLGPGPVEVCQRFEGPQARVAHTPLQAATVSLGLFDLQDVGEPGFVHQFLDP